jgi:hypothetical protein
MHFVHKNNATNQLYAVEAIHDNASDNLRYQLSMPTEKGLRWWVPQISGRPAASVLIGGVVSRTLSRER